MDPITRLLAAPPDLPVREGLLAVVDAVATAGIVVVSSPPGSGKTTLVPPALAAHVARRAPAGAAPGRIVVTQPRRIAARAGARRLAQLLGEPVGATAGFTVRGEEQTSAATRIELVTAGVLLRRLQRDPELPGVAAVVLDEVHERTLETDLLQAFLLEVRESLRDDLPVVLMSATPELDALARVWGPDLRAVDVPGALHPVVEVWSPPARPLVRSDDRGVTRDYLAHVVATTVRTVAGASGDVLVFVPGVREVDAVASGLAGCGVEVLRLHGRMPSADQDRVLTASPHRRVIVSTAVAESSLTVPGVRVVVDAGLAREPFLDPARGIGGLRTVRVSRAVAQQRAGRAGRESPGVVVRCWSQGEHATLSPQARPEIATADLTGVVLEAARWSRQGIGALRLPDAPPPAALEVALETLREIGALDGAGVITARGRRLVDVPAHPRLARALLDGAGVVGPRLAAEVVAMLAEDVRSEDGDLTARLSALRAGRGRPEQVAAWRRSSSRFAGLAGGGGPGGRGGAEGGGRAPGAVGVDGAAAHVVALAYPERLARLRPGGTGYLLASGTGAVLPAGSPLRGQAWLAVAELDRSWGADAVVRSAVPIDEADALAAGAALLVQGEEVGIEGTRVVVRTVARLGAIVLRSTRKQGGGLPPGGAELLRTALRSAGLGALTWTAGAAALRARLALLHRAIGGVWPAVDDDALLARLEQWWPPATRDLARIDTLALLRTLLPWPEAAALAELAPERVTLPSGRSAAISYDGEAPVLAVRVQDAFGLRATPRVAGGRVAVVMHLLSPAGRPAAITSDLESFWENGYRAVRADLRGRYPKHAWPEKP